MIIENPINVKIVNGINKITQIERYIKNKNFGYREFILSDSIFVSKNDFDEIIIDEKIGLLNYCNVTKINNNQFIYNDVDYKTTNKKIVCDK